MSIISYKIKIKPTSPFATPLHSDILWGQFISEYSSFIGNQKLNDVLDKVGDKPFLAFSDAFSKGQLPIPIVKPGIMPVIVPYQKQKEIKKRKEISIKNLEKIRTRLSFKELIKVVYEELDNCESSPELPKQIDRVRTAIDRNLGSGLKGALFETSEIHYPLGAILDIYCVIDNAHIGIEEVKKILNLIGETGFGKDRSIGMGKFSIESMDESPVELKPVHGANLFMSLSHGFPDSSAKLFYGKTVTKFGKHGGEWAVKGNHFKNPIVLFKPGSTFNFTEKKEVFGKCLDNISINPGRHLHGAWLIPYYIKNGD